MSSYNISTRYAKALMELAVEKNILKQVAEDMELLFNGIAGSKELRTILKSPVIKTEKKEAILSEIFKAKISSVSADFIRFVVEKKRENLIYDILKRFKDLYYLKINQVKAKVKSSIELSDTQKNQLQTSLEEYTQKKVISTYSIDESIIGGFVVKINDTVLDASIKQQLDKLRKTLFEHQNIVINKKN